jgi:hypothetical protein
MSGEGKTVGVVGGILVAIGAAVAHGADDCAKAGLRAGAHAGDDLARPAVVGRGLSGSDDLGRGASRMGAAPALGDEAVRVSPGEEAIKSLAEEGSLQALDLMLDEEPAAEASPLIPALALRPEVIVLARTTSREGALERIGKRGPLLVVIGHAKSDEPERLLTEDGALDVVEIQQVSARAARASVVLVCEGAAVDAACAKNASAGVDLALAALPKQETDLVRGLLSARAKQTGSKPTLHRVVRSGDKLRRVHSRVD